MVDWTGGIVEDRGNMFKRLPPHIFVAASAWGCRFVTAAVMLVSIRILMKGLGTEQYAVLSILVGLQGWYMLGDFSLGISLQNHISERRANAQGYDDLIRAASIISLLIFLIVLGLLLFLSATLSLSLLKEFNVLNEWQKTTGFFTFGVLSLLSCFGSIIYKIWYAENKGYWANIMPAIASVAGLAGVVIVINTASADKLFWIIVANYFPAAGIPTVFLICRFWCGFKSMVMSGRGVFKVLLKRAFKFWGFSLMAVATLQVDYLIMSQFMKAYDIVVYNLSSKLFMLIFFIYSATLTAAWPVCSECIARGDYNQVRKYLKNHIIIGIIFVTVASIALIIALPTVCRILSPTENIEIPRYFIAVMGGYYVMRVWTDTFAMVLMSMSYMRPFWVFVPFQTLISVFCQWKLGSTYGIYGVVFGLMISYVCTVMWALPLALKRKALELEGKVAA